MERRQIGLKLVMDEIKLPVTVESFNDRLILQKAIYLAQAAGVHLGYYFRWYLRGPYCPAVAEDGFCVATETQPSIDHYKGWTLDEESSKKLRKIRALFRHNDRKSLAKKLELLASTHFLIEREQVPDRSSGKIAEVLRKFGKDYNADEVDKALGELTSNGVLD